MTVWVCFVVVCVFVSVPANADWDVGDSYKMHYPQLPDLTGWEVAATVTGAAPQQINRFVADDWKCSERGPVSDSHFWGSWKNGVVGKLAGFNISIWLDDPAGVGGYFDDNNYSMPLYKYLQNDGNYINGQRWSWTVTPNEYTERLWYESGNQGWYDPHTGLALINNHTQIFQYNVVMSPTSNMFMQEEGTIYWLAISAILDPSSPAGAEWGWKTSRSMHYMDDAVYSDSQIVIPPGYPHEGWLRDNWIELHDPLNQNYSLDMAFVITPEPGSLLMLIAGVGSIIRRRS